MHSISRLVPRLAAPALALCLVPAALGQPDLCASGPEDITITHFFGDPLPQLFYTVENCGTAPGMNWTSSVIGAIAAFTSIDNAGGTIDELGGTDVVNVQFNLSAAPIGVQQVGAIRFFQDTVSKFSRIIRFTLVKTEFELGDSLIGDLAAADDREAGAFEGLKGTKVKITFQADDPALRARVTVAAADATVLKSWKTKKNGKKTKKQFTLPSTGEFAVIVEPISGTGTYSIQTQRKKLPKTAVPRLVSKLKAESGTDTAEVEIGAYPGAMLNANVEAQKGTDIGTLAFAFLRPDGSTVDTSAFDSTSASAFHIVQMPLSQFGIYRLRISGMTATDTVNVPVTPYQPPQANGEVDIDA